MSCEKFRQFRPDNLHKIFDNEYFTEKHNDGNSTSNAKKNKCWKNINKCR